MTYKNLTIGLLTACQTCYAVVCQYDQDAHDQAMHTGPTTTVYNVSREVVVTYPNDWREPVIADKKTCYHPTQEQLDRERKVIHEAMTEHLDEIAKRYE